MYPYLPTQQGQLADQTLVQGTCPLVNPASPALPKAIPVPKVLKKWHEKTLATLRTLPKEDLDV